MASAPVSSSTSEDLERRLDRFRADFEALVREMGQVIVGHDEVVRGTLTALYAGGHVLLEGVPGLGKTLLVKTLAQALALKFQRIQFTPDLMPADIIGTNVVLEMPDGRKQFEFQPGPVFANIVLADEINRATPKTQSALLEAMQEQSVTVAGHTYPLPRPFLVLATQNPYEFEGTYPLPESQLDRFLLRLRIGYPDRTAEKQILVGHRGGEPVERLHPVLSAEEVLTLQQTVRQVRFEETLTDYLLDLVAATRKHPDVYLGGSTRAALSLYRAAQALAVVEGRDYVVPDDVKRLAGPVLAHRILPRAARRGTTEDAGEEIVRDVIARTPVPVGSRQ